MDGAAANPGSAGMSASAGPEKGPARLRNGARALEIRLKTECDAASRNAGLRSVRSGRRERGFADVPERSWMSERAKIKKRLCGEGLVNVFGCLIGFSAFRLTLGVLLAGIFPSKPGENLFGINHEIVFNHA